METKTTITACSEGDFQGAEIVLETIIPGMAVEAPKLAERVIDHNFEI